MQFAFAARGGKFREDLFWLALVVFAHRGYVSYPAPPRVLSLCADVNVHSQKAYVQLMQPGSSLALKMGRYWYSFAKHGDPNLARTLPEMPEWPRYANATDENIVFDEPLIRTEAGLRKAQCELCATTASCQPPS